MWIRLLALSIGAFLLAGPTYIFAPVVGGALLGIAGLSAVASIVVGLGPKLRRRNAYDLQELKRVHEEEELRALDPEGALGQPESVVCPRCLADYPYRLGACPRCGASR
jgi:hypothetical protein